MESQETPTEVWGMYAGPIDQNLASKINEGIQKLSHSPIKCVHLAFQSAGGNVGDGVFLYNLLKSSPVRIVAYNIGSVMSAGVTAFIGFNERKCSKHGAFMMHRVTTNHPIQTGPQLQSMVESVKIDDDRLSSILKERTNVPAEFWNKLDRFDAWVRPEEALEWGIVDEIAEFSPPFGQPVFNI